MGSPIKILVLASIGLFAYGAQASLLEGTISLTHYNDLIIAWQNTANHSKALNHHAFYSENSDDFINKNLLAMRSLKNDPVAAGEFSMGWGIEASNEFISGHQQRLNAVTDMIKLIARPSYLDLISYKPLLRVPLPTVTWLFLGFLLTFLRIQRSRVVA